MGIYRFRSGMNEPVYLHVYVVDDVILEVELFH